MNKELQCNIVNDLLPLYMDDLTSEETNSFIKKHLEECQNCQNEYRTFKAELSNSANRNNATKMQEIDYLKKINIYQKMNFVLGAIISFLFGACLPVLKVTVSGVIVCLIYMIIMFIIKKKLNSKTSRNSQP